MLNLDKSLYNKIVNDKLENEQHINELYASLDNFTMDDKQIAIECIHWLKEINDDYDKYIVIYNNSITNQALTNEYIVIYGDTIQSIASKMTGDFNNWKAIMKYNNLSDPDIQPGDVLLIPNDL